MRITGFFTSPRSVVVARCTQMAKGVGHVEATLKADAPTRQSPLGPHKRPLVREAEGAGLPGRAEMCASVKKGRTVKTHPRVSFVTHATNLHAQYRGLQTLLPTQQIIKVLRASVSGLDRKWPRPVPAILKSTSRNGTPNAALKRKL